MEVFVEAFNLGTLAGIWQPINLKSTFFKQLYHVYMFFSFSQITVLIVTQLIFTLFFTNTFEDFTEAAYFIFTSVNSFVKALVIIKNRTLVLRLTNKLKEKQFMPQNEKEKKVHMKYNNLPRLLWRIFFVCCESGMTVLMTRPLIFSSEKGELPLKAWFPFDATTDWGYIFIYSQQFLAALLIPVYILAPDTIMIGFMVNTKVQLEFLILRLQELCKLTSADTEENKSMYEMQKRIMKQCIQHHIEVYAFSDQVNEVFSSVILVQFLTSSTVLGVTGYLLVMRSSSGLGENFYLLLYMAAVLSQFFSYCWFGTQVTYKSSNFMTQMCEIDWPVMNVITMKNMLIMMMRSTSPITFSFGPFIQLSLETFTKIIKISYSAVNLLKSTI